MGGCEGGGYEGVGVGGCGGVRVWGVGGYECRVYGDQREV